MRWEEIFERRTIFFCKQERNPLEIDWKIIIKIIIIKLFSHSSGRHLCHGAKLSSWPDVVVRFIARHRIASQWNHAEYIKNKGREFCFCFFVCFVYVWNERMEQRFDNKQTQQIITMHFRPLELTLQRRSALQTVDQTYRRAVQLVHCDFCVETAIEIKKYTAQANNSG